MKFLNRLFHRREASPPEEEMAERDCPHVALVPLWGSAEDIGNNAKVSHYECESCKMTFSREDGERIRAQGAERLRVADEERRNPKAD